jgi:hypothetical protein
MPLHVSSTMCSSSGRQNCIIQSLVSSHSVGASSWLITKTNILRCTVSKTPKLRNYYAFSFDWATFYLFFSLRRTICKCMSEIWNRLWRVMHIILTVIITLVGKVLIGFYGLVSSSLLSNSSRVKQWKTADIRHESLDGRSPHCQSINVNDKTHKTLEVCLCPLAGFEPTLGRWKFVRAIGVQYDLFVAYDKDLITSIWYDIWHTRHQWMRRKVEFWIIFIVSRCIFIYLLVFTNVCTILWLK